MAKERRAFLDSIMGSIILFTVTFISWLLLSFFDMIPALFTDSNPALYTVLRYAIKFYQVIFCVVFMLIYKPDRPLFSKICPGGGNTIKNVLIGLALGLGTNLLCAFVSILRGDISLYYSAPNWFYILLCIIGVLIQTGVEEYVCRFFLYQHLYRGYKGPWAAIIVPSMIFSLLHFSNPGADVITGIHSFVIGVVWSLMVYVFDSFYMAWAYHFIWNYTQSIILGLPNSGLVFPLSIFKLEAATAEKAIAYDPVYGIEGSLLALICNILLMLILLYFAIKKRKAEKSALLGNED